MPEPIDGTQAGEDALDEVRRELASLAERAAIACRAGLEELVVAVALDLGRCVWVGENAPRLSNDPIENVRMRCREYVTVLDFGARALPPRRNALQALRSVETDVPVEERTHTLYGGLWAEFDEKAILDEATSLLRTRLERNGVGRDAFAGKRCLDAGCGSGRYAVALRALGARTVVGVDLGLQGILDGRARAAQAGVEGVQFCVGSVLRLPFMDGAFDFVMSNGVLHHTRDPLHGLREMRRVLKSGGTGWLYLYNSDGIYWMVRKTLRRMVESIPQEVAKAALTALGVSPNRLFLVMDGLYVPIEENYTFEEVARMLAAVGFRSWRLLARGADRDLSEAVHRGDAYAAQMYGQYGDLRFWIQG